MRGRLFSKDILSVKVVNTFEAECGGIFLSGDK
jgi:hypothetical protein